MGRTWPRVVRYGLTGFVLIWVALAGLSVVVFGYNLLEAFIPWVPRVDTSTVSAVLSSPILLGGTAVVVAVTAAIGKWRFGTFAALTVAIAKQVDSVFGFALYESPLMVGRVMHNDVAWRLEYREGGHIETASRECPFCGLELIEAVMSRDVVHGVNSGMDPGEANRSTVRDTWEDVYGDASPDGQGETLALACPTCNFSTPESADVRSGQDGAHAKFKGHVERMRSGTRLGDEFGDYTAIAREAVGGDPRPMDIWDAYVRSSEAEDVLSFDPDGGASHYGGPFGRDSDLSSGAVNEHSQDEPGEASSTDTGVGS